MYNLKLKDILLYFMNKFQKCLNSRVIEDLSFKVRLNSIV